MAETKTDDGIAVLREQISELTAELQETRMRNIELASQLVAAQAEKNEIKNSLKTDSGNQEIILKKIEKMTNTINEKSEAVDSIPEGLTATEVAVVRIARQDEIERIKLEKQRLRDLLGVE
ncbi:hypothetical protein [Methanosarcina siciliae]|nr:hypothetical protein [Methanosarcina siciliae]